TRARFHKAGTSSAMGGTAVAGPVPGLGPLTYAVPDDVPEPSIGARVLVPLGNRIVTGIAIPAAGSPPKGGTDDLPTVGGEGDAERTGASHTGSARPADLKLVTDVLDSAAFLPPDVVNLALWVADYYACGVGEAIP